MSVSKETILRISRLARLDLQAGASFCAGAGQTASAASADACAAEANLEAFIGQMDKIVSYLDILKEADADGVEPLYSPMQSYAVFGQAAALRPDIAGLDYPREDILRNAPEQADGFFVVPKVL